MEGNPETASPHIPYDLCTCNITNASCGGATSPMCMYLLYILEAGREERKEEAWDGSGRGSGAGVAEGGKTREGRGRDGEE